MKKNKCFGTLFGFELRKILKNRIAIAAFLIFFVFGFMQGELEVTGNIDADTLTEYSRFNGRVLDEGLISEWNAATDEYGNVINDEDIAYDTMKEWIMEIAGYNIVLGDVSEETLYAGRLECIEEVYKDSYLNDGEIEYWRAQEEKIDKPFVWRDAFIEFGVQNGISNTIIIMLLVLTVSLSAIFSMETQRKTDPMIRASINGIRELYFAKILAGTVFCLATVFIYLGIFIGYVSVRWGLDGMGMAEQVIYPFTQMDLTAGQTTVILVILTVLGSLLLSTVTMFTSCVLRNGMGTMAIIMAGYFGLFALGTMIPMEMKTLSKVVCLFPAMQISPRIVYEFRLFKIAGHYFRSYQVAAMSYAVISAVLIVIGYVFYKRYEIKSN